MTADTLVDQKAVERAARAAGRATQRKPAPYVMPTNEVITEAREAVEKARERLNALRDERDTLMGRVPDAVRSSITKSDDAAIEALRERAERLPLEIFSADVALQHARQRFHKVVRPVVAAELERVIDAARQAGAELTQAHERKLAADQLVTQVRSRALDLESGERGAAERLRQLEEELTQLEVRRARGVRREIADFW